HCLYHIVELTGAARLRVVRPLDMTALSDAREEWRRLAAHFLADPLACAAHIDIFHANTVWETGQRVGVVVEAALGTEHPKNGTWLALDRVQVQELITAPVRTDRNDLSSDPARPQLTPDGADKRVPLDRGHFEVACQSLEQLFHVQQLVNLVQ